MALGDQIKLARERKGLNQIQLGKRLGVSGSAVTQWEKGDTRPSSKNLAALIVELGVSYEWLTLPEVAAKKAPMGVTGALGEPAGVAEGDDQSAFEPSPMVPNSRFPADAQYVLGVKDDSADLLVPTGGFLHCVDIERGKMQPRIDELVIARVARGGTVETVACKLTAAGLKPLTSNPAKAALIHIPENFGGEPEVRIQAVIVASWRSHV